MYLSTSKKKGLDSCEIDAAIKSHSYSSPHFIGVFSWDTVPLKISRKSFSLVCNVSPSYLKGSHWFSIFVHKGEMHIFDSLAIISQLIKKSRLEKLGQNLRLNIFINKKRVQSKKSDVCGYYSIAYIIMRSKGYSTAHFLSFFSSKFRENDALVKENVMEFLHASKKIRSLCYWRYLLQFSRYV